MSPYLPGAADDYTRFPRVSGDEPRRLPEDHPEKWFSPRERG